MMSKTVKLTNLGLASGVCSLLQIGDFNILLDCGCGASSSDVSLIKNKIREVGSINCVLLSHADTQHIGALPLALGCSNLADISVICTTPVLKMSQMTLYDCHLNNNMVQAADELTYFSLDDIDHCFRNAVTVKYNQVSCRDHPDGREGELFVCAYPAGRTLGGTSWSIRCGSTEVIYVMDMNLRRETLLDGACLELPLAPALLIVGGAIVEKNSNGNSGQRRKKDRTDDSLLSQIIDTVRSDGNVLIPSDSVGRTLELLLILNKYWGENSLGMYHLIFLSPMACNVIEFARCQLEWMSDTLCEDFYLGKQNPFALPCVKLLTSLRELDSLGPGPRVILTSDSSFLSGFSRQLLLRWGGDPKCRVLFTDISETETLAADLRSQTQPVIATVVRSERVPLTGSELEAFEKAENFRRRNLEAASQRRRRERELTDLANLGSVSRTQPDEIIVEFEAGQSTSQENTTWQHEEIGLDTGESDGLNKRLKMSHPSSTIETDKPDVDVDSAQIVVAKGRITRFAQPRYRMFETRDMYTPSTEYGRGIADFDFRDLTSSISRYGKELSANVRAVPSAGELEISDNTERSLPATDGDFSVDEKSSIPTKVVGKKTLVQFTCGFKEVSMGGRSDSRAIKTLIHKLCPQRVVIMKGGGNVGTEDRQALAKSIRETGIEAWSPEENETVSFVAATEKIKLLIPQSVVMNSVSIEDDFGGAARKASNHRCTAALIHPCSKYKEIRSKVIDGIRTARIVVSSEGRRTSSFGPISVGEVLLETLKQRLELAGITVEYKLGRRGGMLICGNAVIIRKENENDFVIEGGAGTDTLAVARKALYEHYTFL